MRIIKKFCLSSCKVFVTALYGCDSGQRRRILITYRDHSVLWRLAHWVGKSIEFLILSVNLLFLYDVSVLRTE